jgi:hypothetical protein
MLDEGVYTSVSEIGDAENISKSYASRIFRLALLAPRRAWAQQYRRSRYGDAVG